MSTDEKDNDAERQVRLEKMLAEFRAAQRRRLVKQGMALWNQTETASVKAGKTEPSGRKFH